jgi:hypothetical protein
MIYLLSELLGSQHNENGGFENILMVMEQYEAKQLYPI